MSPWLSFVEVFCWSLVPAALINGRGWLVAGIMHIAASSFASPSLLSLPIFVHAERADNFVMAVACAAISIVLAFAVTWVLGFDETGTEA